MTWFDRVPRVCLMAALSMLLAVGGAYVYAQTTPAPPAVTCEQQLEQAQRQILQLRKANAQSDFTAASLQEQVMDLQKKQAEAAKATPDPKKAAEHK